MAYVNVQDISYVQIDHTSNCNLHCPQCARTHEDGANPDLPLSQLKLDDYQRFFSSINYSKLEHIIQCGNYGDIIASSTILECLDWLRASGYDSELTIMTNGSGRGPEFWVELARILGKRGKVVFSIDGLEATNSNYRKGSHWHKIESSVKAYVDAGGRARWDFLVFDYNEHQIENVKLKAKEWGFEALCIKKTNRFINDSHYKGNSVNQDVLVDTKNMNATLLAAPLNENYKSTGPDDFKNIVEEYGGWTEYVNKTKISCRWKKKNGIFLDFNAQVWPCTWVASGKYHYGSNWQKQQILQLESKYGRNFNSLRNFDLAQILAHPWFSSELEQSWLKSTSSKTLPRLMTCGRTCGEKYDFSSSSTKNREFIRL